MNLFGSSKPKVTPKEQVREWKHKLQGEQRALDRQIRSLDMEEKKVQTQIKQAAKKGEMSSCRVLAKELVRSRKAKERMFEAKARMNSVVMQMQTHLATMKVADHMHQSAMVMSSMSEALRLPELRQTVMALGKEMEKAGFIEEMINDTMEMVEGDDVAEAADEEVLKVMEEITGEVMSSTASAGRTKLTPAQEAARKAATPDRDLEAMAARLDTL
eukprot:GILK01003133.1.p1 GENE.GILK01003133.1~~GILK01003133.1.p1  ORF type:complete len:216 (+),score=46.18 GILK01003133.1:64-711(+)